MDTARELPKKMKAIVAYAPGDYRFEVVDTPRAGEGEMILKVEACGICAGDVKAFHGAKSFWGGDGNPPYIKAPMIPGHEFVGRVVEIGDKVKGNWKIGDRICPEQIVPCGECMFCKTGRHWMCEKHDLFGFQNNVNGGMAEYVRLTKEALPYLVPADMPVEKAALIEPYACAFHCVDRAQPKTTDFVVQSGAGTLGLGMIGALRQANPKCLVVLDMNDERLKKAKEFGADIVMNPGKEDVVSKIKEMTGGYGCDIYIEATGHPSSVQQFIDSIPDSLRESASIDGAGEWYIFLKIILPLCGPVIATLVIFQVVNQWNNFLWPLVVVSNPKKQVISVGLAMFNASETARYLGPRLAVSVLGAIPLMIVYLFLQKYIVQSVMLSGVKE